MTDRVDSAAVAAGNANMCRGVPNFIVAPLAQWGPCGWICQGALVNVWCINNSFGNPQLTRRAFDGMGLGD